MRMVMLADLDILIGLGKPIRSIQALTFGQEIYDDNVIIRGFHSTLSGDSAISFDRNFTEEPVSPPSCATGMRCARAGGARGYAR